MNTSEKKWIAFGIFLIVIGAPESVWSLYQFHQIVVARENAVEVTATVVKVGRLSDTSTGVKTICRPVLAVPYKGKVIQHQTQQAASHLCYQKAQKVRVWFRYRKTSKSSVYPSEQVPGWILPVLLLSFFSMVELAGGILAFVVFLRYIARKQGMSVLPESAAT